MKNWPFSILFVLFELRTAKEITLLPTLVFLQHQKFGRTLEDKLLKKCYFPVQSSLLLLNPSTTHYYLKELAQSKS